MTRSRWRRAGVVALVVVVIGAGGVIGVAVTRHTGPNVHVQVAGLPSGAQALVQVSGEGQRKRVVHHSAWLTLGPGRYELQALVVHDGGAAFYPLVSTETFRVGSRRSTVHADYADEVPDTTVVLGVAAMAVATRPDSNVLVLPSANVTSVAENRSVPVAVGDVLVVAPSALVPDGEIAKVIDVGPDGSNTVVETEAATVRQALPQATIEAQLPIVPVASETAALRPVAGAVSGRRVVKLVDDEYPSDGCEGVPKRVGLVCGIDLSHELNQAITSGAGCQGVGGSSTSTLDASVRAAASLRLVAHFYAAWTVATLADGPTVRFTVTGRAQANARLTTEATLGCEIQQTSPPYEFEPIVLPTPVPIVVIPRLEFLGDLTGSVQAAGSFGVGFDSSLTLGLALQDGSVSPIDHHKFSPTLAATPTIRASAALSIGPRIDFDIEGIAGPYLEVDGFGQATVSSDPSQDGVFAGINALIGIDTSELGFSFSRHLTFTIGPVQLWPSGRDVAAPPPLALEAPPAQWVVTGQAPTQITGLEALACPSVEVCYAAGPGEDSALPALSAPAGGYPVGPGVIETTSDGGDTWHAVAQIPTGQVNNFSCPSAEVCWASVITGQQQGDTLLETTDGGASWSVVAGPMDANSIEMYISALACSSASACVVGASSDVSTQYALDQTTDGGASWSPASVSTGTATFGGIASLACPTQSNCFASAAGPLFPPSWGFKGFMAGILTSTDSGESWSPSDQGGDVGPLACATASFCVVPTETPTGGTSTTSDAGASWLEGAAPGQATSAACASAFACFASVRGNVLSLPDPGFGALEETTDGGLSWEGAEMPGGTVGAGPVACAGPQMCMTGIEISSGDGELTLAIATTDPRTAGS